MPRDNPAGKTSVFWDVDDFPVPDGRKIRDIVEDTLRNKGYTGEVSITAYGAKDPFSPEETAEARLTFVERIDKYWRLHKMFVDIAWWTTEAPRPCFTGSNVMVVAKNIKADTEFVSFLRGLYFGLGFNVLLVVPDDCEPEQVPLPRVRLIWYWKSFVQGGEPLPRAELEALVARGKDALFFVEPDEDD
ncbi:unnamed protein product [Microthlaspi erraticum]|uniref:NYN domain-containing protein n=1 Tax=Microthlaspi erraticum TaxID=1685480 RepID=A0A6D2IME7_9BRAS|nr:unnamed protein product [Microthlaspi erraticum]